MRRAKADERIAIAAYCSAVGRSVTAVSDTSTVWLRPTTTVIPNGVASGSSSITSRTCFNHWVNGPAVPVTIRSPSPRAATAGRAHGGGEIVAVLVDQPLDLAG